MKRFVLVRASRGAPRRVLAAAGVLAGACACLSVPARRTPRLPPLRAPNRVPLVIYAPPEWVPLAPRPQVLSGPAASSFRGDVSLRLAREADRALRRYFAPVEVIREWSAEFVDRKAVAAVSLDRFDVLPDGAVRVELIVTLYDREGQPVYEGIAAAESDAPQARGCTAPAREVAQSVGDAGAVAIEEAFTRLVEDLDRDDPAVSM